MACLSPEGKKEIDSLIDYYLGNALILQGSRMIGPGLHRRPLSPRPRRLEGPLVLVHVLDDPMERQVVPAGFPGAGFGPGGGGFRDRGQLRAAAAPRRRPGMPHLADLSSSNGQPGYWRRACPRLVARERPRRRGGWPGRVLRLFLFNRPDFGRLPDVCAVIRASRPACGIQLSPRLCTRSSKSRLPLPLPHPEAKPEVMPRPAPGALHAPDDGPA